MRSSSPPVGFPVTLSRRIRSISTDRNRVPLMSLTVAVQMDPIERIRVAGDSTFALLLEAQARGHRLFYYTPDRLALVDGAVFTTVQPLSVHDVEGSHFDLGDPRRASLTDFQVVLMRQDPPFDLGYITATHLLERVHPKTLVIN